MREIKFRVWNSREKNMSKPFGLSHADSYVLGFPSIENVMQYTGITCNGHEWYEGDILENDGDWYQISWDNDQARWEAVGIKSTGEALELSELVSQETWVQGNIYQNKELLE